MEIICQIKAPTHFSFPPSLWQHFPGQSERILSWVLAALIMNCPHTSAWVSQQLSFPLASLCEIILKGLRKNEEALFGHNHGFDGFGCVAMSLGRWRQGMKNIHLCARYSDRDQTYIHLVLSQVYEVERFKCFPWDHPASKGPSWNFSRAEEMRETFFFFKKNSLIFLRNYFEI